MGPAPVDPSCVVAGCAVTESVDTSPEMVDYEVAVQVKTDAYLSPMRSIALAATWSYARGDELPQSSIRARRRIG